MWGPDAEKVKPCYHPTDFNNCADLYQLSFCSVIYIFKFCYNGENDWDSDFLQLKQIYIFLNNCFKINLCLLLLLEQLFIAADLFHLHFYYHDYHYYYYLKLIPGCWHYISMLFKKKERKKKSRDPFVWIELHGVLYYMEFYLFLTFWAWPSNEGQRQWWETNLHVVWPREYWSYP